MCINALDFNKMIDPRDFGKRPATYNTLMT